MKIDILGTEYTIYVKNYSDDPYFKRCCASGYRDAMLKEIVLCDLHTFPGFKNETDEYILRFHKENLRHEIVHAFLYESGLDANSQNNGSSWADNEEIVDWFAIQGPKICKAWKEAGALDCPHHSELRWVSAEEKLPESTDENMLIYGEWVGASGTVHRDIWFASLDEVKYTGVKPIAWMSTPEPPYNGGDGNGI